MERPWTAEQRARQSQLVHTWKLWEQSTGPRSPEGKAVVAQNPYKVNTRGLLKELNAELKEQREALKRFK
jgi:hypothetical protein